MKVIQFYISLIIILVSLHELNSWEIYTDIKHNSETLKTENKLEDGQCKILNCIRCHKGLIGEACDECKAGFGIDKKAVGNDLCVDCNSAVPHCTSCLNDKLYWNCFQCQTNYRLIQNETKDDMCTSINMLSFLQ